MIFLSWNEDNLIQSILTIYALNKGMDSCTTWQGKPFLNSN